MNDVIVVESLRKHYGDFEAVRGVDLDVAGGEIFAFLGPNGAGKTTTVEILEGFRTATSGVVRVLGEDPAHAPLSWREQIGIVLQQSEVEPELTGREALRMYSAYYEAPRPVDEVIELVGLTEKADDRVAKMSGGQQRRLDLALALIGDPELIFLDEPTTGFDPSARRESWEMIENLRSLGRTVLLTTHYMDEAQHLADRIAVIAAGEIVARGTADQLAHQVRARPTISWTALDDASDRDRLNLPVDLAGGRASVSVDEADLLGTIGVILAWAGAGPLEGFEVSRPSLEDTYLQLVEQASRGALTL